MRLAPRGVCLPGRATPVRAEQRSESMENILPCGSEDTSVILEIINDAAKAYKGAIPGDRWHEPYMTASELQSEIDSGVRFYGYRDASGLLGVMGIQDVKDVTLIRHAYVRTTSRGRGIGGALLTHLRRLTDRRVLVGTWRAAGWAIRFYRKHGFVLVSDEEANRLQRTYWNVPERQVEESVVLANVP